MTLNVFVKAEHQVSSVDEVLVSKLEAASEGRRDGAYFKMAFLSVAHSVLCMCVCVLLEYAFHPN